MKRIYSLLFILASATSHLYADVNPIVIGEDDCQPVPYVCAVNKAKTFSIISDVDGRFCVAQADMPKDSVVFTRIGYYPSTFAPTKIPDTIYLKPHLTELQGVVVHPLRRKTLGGLYKPNAIQKLQLKHPEIYDRKGKHSHTFNKEMARRFKLKHDSHIEHISMCLLKAAPSTLIFNLYRKVDGAWVNVLNNPITKIIDDSYKDYDVVTVDVSELLSPQPAGEYLVSIMSRPDDETVGGCHFSGTAYSLSSCYDRSPIDDNWREMDVTISMELEIAY